MIFIMSCGSFCFLLPFLAALLVAGDEGKVEGPVIGFLARVAADIANVEHEKATLGKGTSRRKRPFKFSGV